tara:strand:+ start:160 stop:603 length:444 start_codon:yes stop_codon:yes gene_type:complete
MSKNGRYAADRKKVVALTAATTITAAQCGTIFTLDGGTASYNVTLPTLADAGNGWWCKFVLLANKGTNAQLIQAASGDEDTIIASVFGGLDDNSNADNVLFDAAADSVRIPASQAKAGDTIEFICLGSKWHAQAFSAGTDVAIDVTT